MAGKTTTPQTSKALESRSEIRRLTVVQATFLSAPRMVRLEASRSSSAGSQLCLRPVPILSGRLKKAACLLQTVSEIFPEGLLPFPAPEQFSPVAEGTLQIWATGFRSVSYCNAGICIKSPVFFLRSIEINEPFIPGAGHGSRTENLQYRFAMALNRFTRCARPSPRRLGRPPALRGHPLPTCSARSVR